MWAAKKMAGIAAGHDHESAALLLHADAPASLLQQ